MHRAILTQSIRYKKQKKQQWHDSFQITTEFKKLGQVPSVCYHELPAPDREVWSTTTKSQQSQKKSLFLKAFANIFCECPLHCLNHWFLLIRKQSVVFIRQTRRFHFLFHSCTSFWFFLWSEKHLGMQDLEQGQPEGTAQGHKWKGWGWHCRTNIDIMVFEPMAIYCLQFP